MNTKKLLKQTPSSEVTEFQQLLNKTFTSVYRLNLASGDELHFLGDGFHYCFKHQQSCCEDVYIESVTGDLKDLQGSEILKAEVYTKSFEGKENHYTYTFYKFATAKGYVDIRWCGSSNGYYSEDVGLYEVVSERDYKTKYNEWDFDSDYFPYLVFKTYMGLNV